MHPDLYEGPATGEAAGRAHRRPAARPGGADIDTDAWAWISQLAGQRLFRPPNVAGWDETRWLDTSTFRGRWTAANEVAGHDRSTRGGLPDTRRSPPPRPSTARCATGANPRLIRHGPTTSSSASRKRADAAAVADWQKNAYRALRQNALRMLIATSPDHAGVRERA